jgi:hypothetical protein
VVDVAVVVEATVVDPLVELLDAVELVVDDPPCPPPPASSGAVNSAPPHPIARPTQHQNRR